MKPTPYEDINIVLESLLNGIQTIFGNNLVGVYITGSLSYGGFIRGRSDLDLLVVLHKPVTQEEMDLIKKMHIQIEKDNEKWKNRIECSYIPQDMLGNMLPPKSPRPYIGEGRFYPKAFYGNEWIINNYLLYKHGITLFGPDFNTLLKKVDIKDVQKASIRDLFKEWEPKLKDDEWLDNPHYQSYIVLNLCRILFTVLQEKVASKNISASWVKKEFPRWKKLIEHAEKWSYGKVMNFREQTKAFINFAIDQVNAYKID